MVTLLALGAALSYGVADFLGGAASRRANALRALMISVPTGLGVLIVAATVAGGAPTPHGVIWGVGSGLAGGTGLIMFYGALARGPMSVIAPVSALAAAVLPVAVGLLRGEALETPVLIGVALCMVAIGLVSMEEPKPTAASGASSLDASTTEVSSGGMAAGSGWRGLATGWLRWAVGSGPVMAGVSGACFGVFFVLLHEAGSSSGVWPTAASRGGGFFIVLMAVLVVHVRRRKKGLSPEASPRRRGLGVATIALAVVSGILDAAANVSYFIAAREGVMSLAAVLTSLYPAITVLLARIFYSERLRAVQRLGLAVAIAGVALVTVG